jgi:hypothetical protein
MACSVCRRIYIISRPAIGPQVTIETKEDGTVEYFCPNLECIELGQHDKVFHIDEMCIPLVRHLWRYDIETKYCCSGHFIESQYPSTLPYVIIGVNWDSDNSDRPTLNGLKVQLNKFISDNLAYDCYLELEFNDHDDLCITYDHPRYSHFDDLQKFKAIVEFTEILYDSNVLSLIKDFVK